MKRVVMFSGGVGSWAAARRTVEAHGSAGVVLLFTDTRIEDPDLYRFLDEAAANVGVPLVRIADGRTPWDVFEDRRMLGNSRVAPCSTELKQRPARAWMAQNAPDATVVLGIDWTEEHRLAGAQRGWAPWQVEAPLCSPPYRSKHEWLEELGRVGMAVPKLYREGFAHNNCGGGCVRAGLGRPVSILRDRANGDAEPLTLRDLRLQLELQPTLFDGGEWGGCGCFVAEEAAP